MYGLKKIKVGKTSTWSMVAYAIKHIYARTATSRSTPCLSFINECHLKAANVGWYVA